MAAPEPGDANPVRRRIEFPAESQQKAADDAQRVFDTVAGPNLRMKDNVSQGLAIFIGGVLGMFIGPIVGALTGVRGANLMGYAFFGSLGGILVGLFGSGIVIGVIRGLEARRGR